MPEVKMQFKGDNLVPEGDDLTDSYTLGRQVAHEYYSSATQTYIDAASAAAQVEAEAQKEEVDEFRKEQSKKQTEGKAAESSFAGMMVESLAGRGGAAGTTSKGPMFGKVAAEGGGGGWGEENAPAAMQGAADKVQAELGGMEDPMVDPAMAGASGAGAAFKMSMAMGLKLVPSVARALTAGVVSAGTDYPIGAGADAVGATSPALALPFALTVGLLSGAGIEPIIERGILKAAKAAGTKINPAQLAEQVQMMKGVLANETGSVNIGGMKTPKGPGDINTQKEPQSPQGGQTIRVFHGTSAPEFEVFNTDKGAFFSESKDFAASYQKLRQSQVVAGLKSRGKQRIIEADITLNKPLDLSEYGSNEKIFSSQDHYLGNQEKAAEKMRSILGNPSDENVLNAIKTAEGEKFKEGVFNLYEKNPVVYALMEIFGLSKTAAYNFGGSNAQMLVSGHGFEIKKGQELFTENLNPKVKKFLESLGFDGIVFNDSSVGNLVSQKEGKAYAAFSPEQIKIVKGNKTTPNQSTPPGKAGDTVSASQQPAAVGKNVSRESIRVAIKKRGTRGDNLLNAEDLYEDLISKNAEVDSTGMVTLYHRTTPESAEKIVKSGLMTGKEDRLFFGTSPTGQIEGYGEAVVKVQVPIEKLELNDVFTNEAHVTLKGSKANLKAEIWNKPQQIDDLTKRAVIEEINAEVGNRPLDEALKLLKDQRGATSMLPGAGPLDPVPVKGGSKKSGIPKPPDMVAKGDEFTANKNPDITQERAGNIRLWGADLEPKFMGEIESPEDIMRVISGTHEAFAGEAEAARRGVRSWDDTAAEAKKYGIEDLLGRRLGQALNAEQVDNARTMLVSSADTLRGMATVIKSGQANDLQKADFMRAFNVHYAIQMQLAGAAAEAGRALNIFRRVAQADAISVGKVKDFLAATSLDKRVGPEALADAISSMDSPAQVAAFVKQAKNASTWDMFVEAWINGLLSGPVTHAVNVASNMLTSLWVIPERLLAAGISRIHGGEIRMGEAAAQSFGLIQGFKDGLKLAGQALKTGEGAFDASSKIEGAARRNITAENVRNLPVIKKMAPNALDEGGMAARAVDLLGEGVRLPGRFLGAEDDFFKAIGYRMELQALAYRKGVAEGLSGDDLSKRIKEIVSNPQEMAPEAHLAAVTAAKYQTYTNDLEAGGRGIQTAANKIPGLKLIIPFIRTPANILKFAVERTVLAPMMKNVRADMAAGGARRDMALAKISMGSMTMATVGALAAAGHITGGGPSDTALRSHMMNQGWQPYSLKVGDKYYAYGRLEPIGLILGLAADAVDIMGEAEDMDASELAAVISVAAAKNVTSKTWLRGLSDVVAALEDPDRYGEKYLQRFAGSAVPSVVAQVERTMNPEMSEVRSYVDALKARTPGFSKDLPTRRNLWGEKITFNGALGPDIISPIFTSSVKDSPIDAELVKLKAPVRMPQRKQTFEGVPLNLTPQEYEEFIVRMNDVKLEDTNKTLKKSLNELVTKDKDYKSAEDEIKVKIIKGYIEEAVSKAKMEMLESDSNLRALVDEGHRQAEAAAQ